MNTGKFDLTGKVAVITGGAGLLGAEHAKAIHSSGGTPVLGDINLLNASKVAAEVGARAIGMHLDVTSEPSINKCLERIIDAYGRLDILVNNAARNASVEPNPNGTPLSAFEVQSREIWDIDIAAGLTGSMLCCKVFGGYMASHGGGVIVNIGSEYSLVAPDQRVYRRRNVSESEQPKKPVSYTVIKHGVIGLTRHLAAYWGSKNVRVNTLCPGGIENEQPLEFSRIMTSMVPLGRMAARDDMQGAIMFLCSDASSFMTGATIVVDGGRTIW